MLVRASVSGLASVIGMTPEVWEAISASAVWPVLPVLGAKDAPTMAITKHATKQLPKLASDLPGFRPFS